VTAVEGLLYFREMRPDRGRALYEEALAGFGHNEGKRRALVSISLAREEALAGTPFIHAAIARARDECSRHGHPVLSRLLKVLPTERQ